MHVDSYVELVELGNAEKKRARRREMVGRRSYEGGQGAEGVKPICDINEPFFEIFTCASACLPTDPVIFHLLYMNSGAVTDIEVRVQADK